MKAHFQKLFINEGFSFISKRLDLPRFDSEYHFHPEYELKYVIKSRGKRFVGDSVESFQEGDLVLIGPNIPHYWNNDPEYFESEKFKASAILIMFSQECLGIEFFSLPELLPIKELLCKAKGGIFFKKDPTNKIPNMMKNVVSNEGPSRIIMFLSILNELTKIESRSLLTEESVAEFPLSNKDDHSIYRMRKVHEYVISNFQKKIMIRDVADMANMTIHSFCKYFKRSTKKTFMTFLTELRICHAKKLLIETETKILDICYGSGFDNLSNFNRKFKLVTKMTPSDFRNLYMDK